jgi:hypothetical protein
MRAILSRIIKDVREVLLGERDRFLLRIYRQQETKVTFVNRSELIARPFVPSAQFSPFVLSRHSRGTSFRHSSPTCPSEEVSLSSSLGNASRPIPDITVSLLFFAFADSLFFMAVKEIAVLPRRCTVGAFAIYMRDFIMSSPAARVYLYLLSLVIFSIIVE